MQWRLLTPEEMAEVYARDMVRDFPRAELKPLSAVMDMMARGICRPWGVFDEDAPAARNGAQSVLGLDALAAYLLIACPPVCEMVLLDYFAVRPAYRAAGLGARLLAELRQKEAACTAVLIESEWPAHAPDPALARRRLAFYARAGAADTGWHDRAYDGWFNVLALPCRASGGELRAEACAKELQKCYRVLLPEGIFEKYFELCGPNGETAIPR